MQRRGVLINDNLQTFSVFFFLLVKASGYQIKLFVFKLNDSTLF